MNKITHRVSDRISSRAWKVISVATGSVTTLFMPFMVFAQIDTGGASSVIHSLQDLINLIIPFIIGLAVLVFIFGLFKYVTAGGDEEKLKSARNTIIWGIIIIAVMISVWGLIALVVNTFGLNNTSPDSIKYPQLPSSY